MTSQHSTQVALPGTAPHPHVEDGRGGSLEWRLLRFQSITKVPIPCVAASASTISLPPQNLR